LNEFIGNLSSEDEYRVCASGCAPSSKYLKALRKIKEEEIFNGKGKCKGGQQGASKESCWQGEDENIPKNPH